MHLLIGLSGGASFEVEKIGLYPQEAVVKIIQLKQKAASKLGGVTTGIGFWGSPGWAIGGSLFLGALEDLASKGMQREGLELLSTAENLVSKLKHQIVYFDVEKIINISIPTPESWLVNNPAKVRYDLSQLDNFAKEDFLATHKLAKHDVVDGLVELDSTVCYIHDQREFISVQHAGRSVSIRWPTVASYEVMCTA